ncbi:MAG: cytochrome oxidase subunit III [Bacteroidetes bacterium MedPE-SWsnd-G1]|nr:MAG: cytochrome oxidase subunit III [Bacteroidetes bacterium MedPE-SWsnd-G1]
MEERNLELEYKAAKQKSAKPMLWISMVSMTMMFIGLTSAYIISSKREDWVSFELPSALYTSTLLIVLSSLSYMMAKRSIKQNNRSLTSVFLIGALLLGIGFAVYQLEGFNQLKAAGLYLAGAGSQVSASLLMVISFAHLLHVMAGFIVLGVVIYNHFKKRYNATETLGLELGGIFWHFVDILWVLLFLFFYFIR